LRIIEYYVVENERKVLLDVFTAGSLQEARRDTLGKFGFEAKPRKVDEAEAEHSRNLLRMQTGMLIKRIAR
jgi:hypothetical protein